jgi:hypothetical protein
MAEITVPIDKIVPLTDARDNFSRIVTDIESMPEGLYVLTKGGKPSIALISIRYLEQLMGNQPVATKPIPPRAIDRPKPQATSPVSPLNQSAPINLSADTQPPNPPIDPTWTGDRKTDQSDRSASQPAKKPINPWPIIPPSRIAPTPATIPTVNSSPVSVGSSPATPPVATAPIQNTPPPPPAPVVSAPVIPPPIAPPISVVPTVPASSVLLPPPPANPTAIPFDEPPKISPDPGEPMASSAPTPAPINPQLGQPIPVNAPSSPAMANSPATASQAPVQTPQDLDI